MTFKQEMAISLFYLSRIIAALLPKEYTVYAVCVCVRARAHIAGR